MAKRLLMSLVDEVALLGRGVVIMAGSSPPARWATTERVLIDHNVLDDAQAVVSRLHRAWARRMPLVIELGISTDILRQPETASVEPHSLEPSFEFVRERLHFLVWANNYDATRGEPIWWHARLAQKLGAISHPEAEIEFDGPRWCDGGPRGALPFPVVHRESIENKALSLTFPSSGQDLGELDPEQRAAIEYRGSSSRVLAPAGSGKTRVLTGRFRYLIESGFEPTRVAALAYNKKAADEMLSRLDVGKRSVRTLHSLAFGLLRKFRGVRVASEPQVRHLLRGLINPPPQLNSDPFAPYLEALQKVRLGLVDPEQVEAERDDIPGFARMFPRFRKRLAEQNLVDFDEQIYGAIELLLQNPEARKLAQRACTHLLVDEFQDLTPAFLLLIRLLSAPGYQLFGVGDDDQVIYGYTGATPDYLIHFSQYFPGATSHTLQTNYRCPRGVVECANHLLVHNRRRIAKTATAANPCEHAPQLLLADNDTWTVRALQQIESWLTQYEPHQVAVLARVNALLMPLQVALQRADIAHHRVVDASVLERTGIRSALAYWRLCEDRASFDPDDLRDALRRPNRKLRREIIDHAAGCRDTTQLRRYALRLDPWPASQLEEFLADLDLLRTRAQRGPAAFFKALRHETEFTSALESLDASGLGAAGSSHQDDLLALEQLAVLCDSDHFEDWLRRWLSEDNTSGRDGIRLSSVHRVKGMEWPCVLIYGAEQGLFPHRLADDVEEERRLFHVAITRAQTHCTLLAGTKTFSPFIPEMQGPAKQPKKKKKKTKLSVRPWFPGQPSR